MYVCKKREAPISGCVPFIMKKRRRFLCRRASRCITVLAAAPGGNVLTFVMQYENFTFQEAMQSLAERAGIELPKQEMTAAQRQKADRRAKLLEINKTAAKYFYMLLRSPQGQHALDYFIRRELTPQTMQHFGLGYSGKYSDDLYRYLKKQGYPDDLLKDSG